MKKTKKIFLIVFTVITALWSLLLISGYSDDHESFWIVLLLLSLLIYGGVVFLICKKMNKKAIKTTVEIIQPTAVNSNIAINQDNTTNVENTVDKLNSLIIGDTCYERRYIYHKVIIVGTQYHGDERLYKNEKVELINENSNEYDSKAIAVCVYRENSLKLVGYLSKDSNIKDMTYDYINQNKVIRAVVDDTIKKSITIGFYAPERTYENYYKNMEPLFTTSLSFKDCDEYMFDIGDEVEFEYDFDKDRDLIIVGNEEKKAPEKLLQYDDVDKYVLFITSVKETDLGSSVKISVYKK